MHTKAVFIIAILATSVVTAPIPSSPVSQVSPLERADALKVREAYAAALPLVLDHVKRTVLESLEDVAIQQRSAMNEALEYPRDTLDSELLTEEEEEEELDAVEKRYTKTTSEDLPDKRDETFIVPAVNDKRGKTAPQNANDKRGKTAPQNANDKRGKTAPQNANDKRGKTAPQNANDKRGKTAPQNANDKRTSKTTSQNVNDKRGKTAPQNANDKRGKTAPQNANDKRGKTAPQNANDKRGKTAPQNANDKRGKTAPQNANDKI